MAGSDRLNDALAESLRMTGCTTLYEKAAKWCCSYHEGFADGYERAERDGRDHTPPDMDNVYDPYGCDDCHGGGEAIYGSSDGPWEPCRTCNGSGRSYHPCPRCGQPRHNSQIPYVGCDKCSAQSDSASTSQLPASPPVSSWPDGGSA